MSDYNALVNLRFNKTTGPIDLNQNSWNSKSTGKDYTVDLVDYSSIGQFSGNCATFNGETSYISKVSGNFIYLADDKEFTISLWLNTDLSVSDTSYTIISDGDTEGMCNKLYMYNDNGEIYITLVDRNEFIYKSNNVSDAFSHNRWNYLALIRYKDSEDRFKLGIFLNGFLVSDYIEMQNPINFDTIRTTIGRGYDAVHNRTSFFNGKLDDIVIMNSALTITDDEINIPTDYLINDGDEEDQVVWEDKEPEYSRYDQISKVSERRRKYNKRNIDWMQYGLTPYHIYPSWVQTEELYFRKGEYYVNRDRHSIKIKMSGIWDNHFFVEKDKYRFLETNFEQGFKDRIFNAAMLFIDGIFIPWSSWDIVKSDKYVTFIISGFRYDYQVNRLEMIIIPNKVYYSEYGIVPDNGYKMFGFGYDGSPNGNDIIISCIDTKVITLKYLNMIGNEPNLIDIDISMKLTANNILIFNPGTNNEAFVNYSIQIGNYLKIRDEGYYDVYVIFNIDHIKSEDNAAFIPNEIEMRNYLNMPYDQFGKNEEVPINLTNLHDEFDWAPTFNPKYGDKYANSMRYIFNYNRNKYDEVYEEIRPVNNIEMTGKELKELQSQSDIFYEDLFTTTYPDDYVFVYQPVKTSDGHYIPGTLTAPKQVPYIQMCAISRDIYEHFDFKHDAYAMIFVNGELPEWYNEIKYINHAKVIFNPKGVHDEDLIEICWFRNISNIVYKLNKKYEKGEYYPYYDIWADQYPDDYIFVNENDKIFIRDNSEPVTGYIKVSEYIPKEDLLVYTDRKGYLNLNPILYLMDDYASNIELVDDKYLNYGLYLGSRRQFLYDRIPVYRESQSLPIPYKFNTGYNPDNYLVFLNGRMLDSAFYRILVPSLADNRIKSKTIYFIRPVKPGDRVDLFYISGTCAKMDTSGDLIIKPIKVQCMYTNQRKFLIPLPYSNYPIEYDTFIVMNKSVRMSTDRYKLSSESKTKTIIEWNKDTGQNEEVEIVLTNYYIELVDQDDYLIPGEELVFLFPYYKAEWETINEPTNDNTLQFITRYAKLVIDTSTVHFQSDYMGNIEDGRYIYVFVNTELIDPSRYIIAGANTVIFDRILSAGSEVAMIIETDRYDFKENNILLSFSNLIVSEYGQIALDLPTTVTSDKEYIFFRNNLLLDSDSYTIHNDKLLLDRNQDDLQPGEVITAVHAIDGGDNANTINFQSYIIKAVVKNAIDIPNFTNMRYTDSNILVFINNEFVPNTYYTVTGNTINFADNAYYSTVYDEIFTSTYPDEQVYVDGYDGLFIKVNMSSNRGDDIVNIGDEVTVFIAYKTINPNAVNYHLGNKEFIRFTERIAKVTTNNQTVFDIPYPALVSSPFRDNKFLLFLRGMFIPEEDYKISEDSNRLTILNPYIKLKANDELTFLFCHVYDFTDITKYEYTTKLANGQNSFVVSSVYSTAIDLANRILVFYGGTYVDSSRYNIDRLTRTITLKDLPGESDYNRRITVVFLYTGSVSNGSVAMLPQSGYICFNEHYIDRNFNREMYLLFVNGKKVPKSYIYDVTNSIKKIAVDIKSRYDLVALSTSPLITEFKEFYDDEETTDYFDISIGKVANGVLEVSCGDNVYYNNFRARYGDYYSVKFIPDRGYTAGEIYVNGELQNYGNVFDDLEITGTDAVSGVFRTITIQQKENEFIFVKCNNTTYSDTFEEIKDSVIEIYVNSGREGYHTGNLHVSGTSVRYDPNKNAYIGTIGTNDIDISIDKATIDTLPFRVINENMYAQELLVEFYDEANTLMGTYTNSNLDEFITVAYGTRMKFILKSTDNRYRRGEHVGPFKVNNLYSIDYTYPLGDLIPEAVSPVKKFYIDIQQNENELLYVDTYPNVELITSAQTKTRHIAPFYGSTNEMYTIGVEPNYGYTAGNIMVSNDRLYGQISGTFSVSVTPAILDTVIFTINRSHLATGSITATLATGEVVGVGSYMIQRNSRILITTIINGIKTGRTITVPHDQKVTLNSDDRVIYDPDIN